MYTIGRKGITFFGGIEIYPILNPDGQMVCQVIGPRENAERLVELLNANR